jgi:hypothetical protein
MLGYLAIISPGRRGGQAHLGAAFSATQPQQPQAFQRASLDIQNIA